MSLKYLLFAVGIFFVSLNLFVTGHVIRPDDKIEVQFQSGGIHFDEQDRDIHFDNLTYYSYHIHVYFLQNNENQTNEANQLRNRFLDRFSVTECNDDCGTWCPNICHWEFNTEPIGYRFKDFV